MYGLLVDNNTGLLTHKYIRMYGLLVDNASQVHANTQAAKQMMIFSFQTNLSVDDSIHGSLPSASSNNTIFFHRAQHFLVAMFGSNFQQRHCLLFSVITVFNFLRTTKNINTLFLLYESRTSLMDLTWHTLLAGILIWYVSSIYTHAVNVLPYPVIANTLYFDCFATIKQMHRKNVGTTYNRKLKK